MTKNTVQRLFVFFLGIPAFVGAALYLSFAKNLLFVIFISLVQVQMTIEFSSFFAVKSIPIRKAGIAAISVVNTAAVYLSLLLGTKLGTAMSSLEIFLFLSIIGLLLVLLPEIFSRESSFDSILVRSGANALVYFYSCVLGTLLVFVTSGFTMKSEAFLTFLLMTFGNDSLAWLAGVTLGRKRGVVAVSPNKSVAGFVGGAAGSIIAGLLAFELFPAAFPSLYQVVLMGIFLGASVVAGDLLESAFKRSCGMKDSSAIIPGRGGVFDSIDSLLFSAPFFLFFSLSFGLFAGVVR